MKMNINKLWDIDIIWYAVDRFERILEFSSLGYGCIPDFILRSFENVELLEKFFWDNPVPFTKIKYYYDYGGNTQRRQRVNNYGKPQRINDIENKRYRQLSKIPIFIESIDLTSKGIYCFETCHSFDSQTLVNTYHKVAEPEIPLLLSDLCNLQVKEILSAQRLNVDVETMNIITV